MKRFKRWLLPVAIVCLLLTVLVGGSCAPQSLGEIFDPSGNPFAHRFSDVTDIRAATFVVAASDSEHRYEADYMCDGTDDHIQIQQAIDALPDTGGGVLLLDGTYYIEVALVLDSYQTLRGQGRNTILTTTTAGLNIITATGGAGTEIEGILVCDLCVDGDAGGVASGEGIFFIYTDHSIIRGCWILDCTYGIDFSDCNYNTCNENIVVSCGNAGICVYADTGTSNHNIIEGNICQGDSDGIAFYDAFYNVVNGNIILGDGSCYRGLYIVDSDYNVFDGNICIGILDNGFWFTRSHHNTISNNFITESGQELDDWFADIFLSASDYNNIQANTCRAGAQAFKPGYGINISNNTCNENVVIDNDLYDDGFGTAPFNDAGTGTKLNVYVVPFSDGTDPQDSGFLIDANTEMARAWLRLPDKVVQVVRITIYARSVVAETHEMELQVVIKGGADNEPFDTHDGSIAQADSVSVDFAADDIIFWINIEAGTLALTGGDSIEIKVLHEAAQLVNCATNAYFRTVEIEYV